MYFGITFHYKCYVIQETLSNYRRKEREKLLLRIFNLSFILEGELKENKFRGGGGNRKGGGVK